MSIVKINPTNNEPHTRLLKDDTSHISNNAYIVYSRIYEQHPDFNPTDERMREICKMGMERYKESKKELRDNELLYVERKGGRGANIVYHIGSKAVNAILIKKNKKGMKK